MKKSRYLVKSMKGEAQQDDIFELSNSLLTKIPCLIKLSLRNEGKIRIFLDNYFKKSKVVCLC